MDEKLEVMARAMWNAESLRASGRNRLIPWEEESPAQQLAWIGAAQAALTALHDAGFAVVPREPTEAMIRAGAAPHCENSFVRADARDFYRAMIAAHEGGE